MRNTAYSALLFLLLGITLPPAFGQGSLTPPAGTPAPTMKTLDQLEPRTPISALPFAINISSGSYYLTGNLTATADNVGIIVAADNVTIDLNGFTLSGAGHTGSGIATSGTRKNLTVRDGTISDWAGTGVLGASLSGGTFEKLSLLNNTTDGINVGSGSTIRACVVSGNAQSGTYGIRTLNNSTVTDCNVTNNRFAMVLGTACTVANCNITNNTAFGVVVGAGSTILNSTVSQNAGSGIQTDRGSSVINCTLLDNEGGVNASAQSVISHCTVSGSKLYLGIRAAGTGTTIDDCTVVGNKGIGIFADNGCTIKDCMIGQNAGGGITVTSRCYVTGNTLEMNNVSNTAGQAGLVITGDGNRIESNNFVFNGYAGVNCTAGSGNIMFRNSFRGAQYIMPTGNVTGPFVDLSVSGGTIPSTASPWANFGY